MDRRDVLKGAAGIGSSATVGGLGVLAATGGATATATQSLGGPVTVTSDDGTVQYVSIFGDSRVEWDGFDTPATQAQISITIKAEDSGGNAVYPEATIHDTGKFALSQGSGWGGTGEELSGEGTSGYIASNVGYSNGSKDPSVYWDLVAPNGDPTQGSNSYALPASPIPASNLNVPTDGSSKTYTLTMTSTYKWFDANGSELFSKSWPATLEVDVTNQQQTSTASDGTQSDGATAG